MPPTQYANDEFDDNRHGFFKCIGSSYVRQTVLTLLPILVMIGIIGGINGIDRNQNTHTARVVSESNAHAISHHTLQFLQAQDGFVGMLVEVVASKLWEDPFSVEGFMRYAFPLLTTDAALTRVAVTHDDGSVMALTSLNARQYSSLRTPADENKTVAEFASMLFLGNQTRDYVRQSAWQRRSPTWVRKTNTTTSLNMGALWLQRARAWAQPGAEFHPPSVPLANADGPDDDLPSIVFRERMPYRTGNDSLSMIGRVVVNRELLNTVFDPLNGTAYAYLMDIYGSLLVASTEARYAPGVQLNVDPTLDAAFQAIRSAAPGPINSTALMLNVDLPFAAGARLLVVSRAAAAPSMLVGRAVVTRIQRALNNAHEMAGAARFAVSTGLVTDLEDVPMLERHVGIAYQARGRAVGRMTITTTALPVLRQQVIAFTVNAKDPLSPNSLLTEVQSPLYMPTRHYEVSRGTGASSAPHSWSTLTTGQSTTNVLSTIAHSVNDSGVVSKPVRLAVPNCAICSVNVMTITECVRWPAAAGRITAAGNDRSCFHLQFNVEDITSALQFTNIDGKVNTAVIAFDDGTVIGAAGNVSATSGNVWDVIPNWNRDGFRLLARATTSASLPIEGRLFTLEYLTTSLRTRDGSRILVITAIDEHIAQTTAKAVVVYVIDGLVLFAVLCFGVHFMYFLAHMRGLSRVAVIMDHAAELQTEELPSEALQVRHVNKDIESMLTSAVQLFLHMRRVRSFLPANILQRHSRRAANTPAGATADGATQDASGAYAPTAATRDGDGSVGVLTELHAERLAVLERRELILVSVVIQTAMQFSIALQEAVLKVATRTQGNIWTTDEFVNLHVYYDGDFLSRAVEGAKALATALPHAAIVLSRGEATFGVAGSAKLKSFVIAGPVLNTTQGMCAVGRKILEGAAQQDPAMTPRAVAPVLMDALTHMRCDPSAMAGSVVRNLGALPSPCHPADVTFGGPVDPDGFAEDGLVARNLHTRDVFVVREVLFGANDLTEPQRLVWAGVGDAIGAVAEGRRSDAESLLAVIAQNSGNTDITRSPWDAAVQVALAAALAR